MGIVDNLQGVASALYTHPQDFFAQPDWLKALYVLLFLLLLYLIRPRPKKKIIPTLMFILGQKGQRSKNSILRHLMRTLFLLLQLLCLLFMCLALAQPFMEVNEDIESGGVVIIVDGSASSKVRMGVSTRFEVARDLARPYLGEKNSIILATDVPRLVIEEGTLEEAQDMLALIKPKDTESNLADALLFAGELASDDTNRIVMVSDMIDTEESADIFAIQKTLDARGIAVEMIPVFTPVRNVGIVDLEVSDDETKLFVRNYNDFAIDTTVTVGDTTEPLSIEAQSMQTFGFVTPPLATKVTLDVSDEFETDNTAYISAPESTKTTILFITNTEEKTFVEKALAASPQISVERAIPPIIPDITHDIVIIKDIDTTKVLPADIDNIIASVKKEGKVAIVMLQERLLELDLKDLIPVSFIDTKPSTRIIARQNVYTEVAEDTFIDFGEVSTYNIVEPYVEKISILATDKEENPLITLSPLGKGVLIYYGIIDTQSTFKFSPDYPLFWNNLISILVNKKDALQLMNRQTGETLTFATQKEVVTPSETITTATLRFDEAGVYTVDDITYAVNLLSETESDVSIKKETTESEFSGDTDNETVRVQKDLTAQFIIFALLILCLEFLYLKVRGDV